MPEPDQVEILLVEDNAQDAELTLRAFRKNHLANKVLVARDGAEALAMLFDDATPPARPRVILLDLKLPKVDGLEVLRRVKADPRTRSIPVVVVTSSNQDPDIETAYARGANSYVVKPVDFDAFVATMRDLGFYWLAINQAPK
jgi:two-component system, response regulator